MKKGFTLAEVLITLGIIGVVAALTMPALISKYQKHVWYTQFRKAATVIDNAILAYNNEYGCEQKYQVSSGSLVGWVYNNLCANYQNYFDDLPTNESPADKLGKYISVAKWITEDNYLEVCKGYEKLPPAFKYDGTARETQYADEFCVNEQGYDYTNGYAFITQDGMLIHTSRDLGQAGGSFVDINGPNKGPNTFGRDLFIFYLHTHPLRRWGYLKEENGGCFSDDDKWGENCAIRLLQEGKMNY